MRHGFYVLRNYSFRFKYNFSAMWAVGRFRACHRGELDAACIQFDLGGKQFPLTWLHYNHWLHYLQPFIMDRISQK